MSIKDLPYFKLFPPKERWAAKAGMPYACVICHKEIFWCDVMNLPDILHLVLVCPKCKKKYQKSYDKKREKLRRMAK